MVDWGLKNITDALQKRLCRFLIHRYLSDFLKSSINLEQLSATLYGGVASVSDVEMDVQTINDAFESMKVPFTAVEGYIGEVHITVPWQEIFSKSVDLEVKQLQLTLQLKQFSDEPHGDIVASMFGSVVGSLATSMELAQNFLNQEDGNESADKGVEQFAEVIDAVIARFRLIFTDATIRLEGSPDPESGLSTALELRIDWIELIDEQLESVAFDTEPVTSQPHSLSAVPDFNKLFHVKGIRLYTDIFTKPEMRDLSEDSMSSSSQVITSMYLRREKAKTRKKLSASSDSSEEHCEKGGGGVLFCSNLQSATASTIYESCYSNKSYMDDEFPSSASSPLTSSCGSALESNPVLFASFSNNVETIIIRVRNNEISSHGPMSSEKEIKLNFDGLCVFLTPSQLCILKTFFKAFASPSSNPEGAQCELGKPMTVQDYQQAEAEFQARNASLSLAGTDFQHGNWGGSMRFHDAQRKPSYSSICEQMTNVSLKSNEPGTAAVASDYSAEVFREISRNECLPKAGKSVGLMSDIITVKASICNVVFVLTHKDYLGQAEVLDRVPESIDSIADMINSYKELAENFFKMASCLRFGVQLNELRRSTKNLFESNHLRFIGEGVAFDYSQIKNVENDSFSMNLEAVDAEFLEILAQSSSSTGFDEYIKLFSFCDTASAAEKSRRLTVSVESDKNLQHYNVAVNLTSCESELDISIIDRISPLLVTKPFYTYPFSSLVRSANDVSRGLKGDLLFTAMQDASSTPPTALSFLLCCPEWNVNLRIPVTDLRSPEPDRSSARYPHWKRNLHKEVLQLMLLDARLEMPPFDVTRLRQYGTVIISASRLNGSFNLNENYVSTGLDSLFLYAGCSGGSPVSLKLSYDNRNTSLKTSSACCSTADYACSSHYGGDGEEDIKVEGPFSNIKVEGPFSKCEIRNENRMVIVVGSTKEMLEFGKNCISNSRISCTLTLPVLHVHLPSRHFYEIIYNRLANDLAMWQPSSPVFSSADRLRDSHELEASNDDSRFQLCKSLNRKNSGNSESDFSCSRQSTLTINAPCSERSHDFCLLANITDGRLLIETEVKEKEAGQTGAVLGKTQMMIVNGFHGNKELSYVYSTSKTAHLFHKNLVGDIQPYETYVLKNDFAEHRNEGIQAEPVVDKEICILEEEDNFAIAVRIDFYFVENIKKMLFGIGIRNTALHLYPFRDPRQFWVNQVISFFDVVDYGIPGYVIPQITTELHLHLSSSQLAYEHSFVNSSSPLSLRVALGSCNISCQIMQDLELYKFECIFEQLKLFASFARNVKGNKSEPVKVEPKLIQMLSIGLLQLEVIGSKKEVENLDTADGSSEERSSPLLEVRCKNDLLKVWACSDSLCTVINAMAELLSAQTTETATPNVANAPTPVDRSDMTASAEPQMSSLEKLVRSAMPQPEQDENCENPAGTACTAEDFVDNINLLSAMRDLNDSRKERSHRDSSGTLGTDEGFCMIEEIPGSGITTGDGKARARCLVDDDTPFVINHGYLLKTAEQSNKYLLSSRYKNYIPRVRYCIDDVSLELHLYGGTDIGTSKPPSKPYSTPSGSRVRRDSSPVGGYYRDNSAHVEVHLSKIKFIFEVYNEDAPALSTRLFTIGSVEILDKMMSTKINKLLYPYVCEQSFPRRSQSPVFAIRLYETHQHEGRMKVSLLPLRINADQDTLEFLEDYVNDLSSGVSILQTEDTAVPEEPEKPVVEVHFGSDTVHGAADLNLTQFMDTHIQNDVVANEFPERGPETTCNDEQQHLSRNPESDLLNMDDDLHGNDGSSDNSFTHERPESASNLFDESGPITMDLMDPFGYPLLSPNTVNQSFHEEVQDKIVSDSSAVAAGTSGNLFFPSTEDEKKNDEKSNNQQRRKNLSETSSRAADSVGKGKIFFKEFTFSPSTMIRLDLSGKRMRPEQGWVLGFLVGLSDFKCTEIHLTELNCCRGLLGYDRCVKYAVNAWLNDINNRQLVQFVATYGPIKSLVEVGLGIRDLFLMPVNEYCREEGHIVKGLQRGAESFGISTATAAVDMLQRVVTVVENVAEMAFDIVAPEYPCRQRRNMIGYTASTRAPNDIRDGFNMALETIGQELSETAHHFQLAAQEDHARGYSAVRGFLRQAPTTAIRPIVAISRATAHILGGLRNQMKPDSYREEMEKWK